MKQLSDYLCVSGQVIPIDSSSFLFTPELCEALRIDEIALQSSYPDMPVLHMPLSVRTVNCLLRGGLNTVGDVNARTDKELLSLRNFGEGCLAEVCRVFPDRVRVREGVQEDARTEKPRKEQPERYAEIARLRREGHSAREIARQYGVTCQRVYQILKLYRDGETGAE
jgi:DNA-binding NarL/FixJ family response regulator